MTVHFENPVHFDNPDRAGIIELTLCQQGQEDGGPELPAEDTVTNDRGSIDCPRCLARQWIDAALDRWIDAALDRWIDAALDRWIISKDFFTSRPDAAALDAAVDAAIFALDLDAAAFDGRMNAALDRWIESDHDRYFAKFLDGRPAAAILATALDAALDRHKQAKESGPA